MDYLTIRNGAGRGGGANYGGKRCASTGAANNGCSGSGEIDVSGLWRQLDELQMLVASGHLSPQVEFFFN